MRVDRRTFLRLAAAAGIASASPLVGAAAAKRAYLVRAHRPAAIVGGRVDGQVVREALHRAVARLVGADSPHEAWASLFGPDDVVGIKVNCLAGAPLSTRPELVDAITSGLCAAGVPPGNIVVWDRTDRELSVAGHEINRGDGVRCFGTEDDYEPTETCHGTFHGRLSRILAEHCTALINCPVLKDHNSAGVTGALKNHYGSFSDPASDYGLFHDNLCGPVLADLNSLPAIRQKTRLVILDALRGQCNDGPYYSASAAWDCATLVVGADPVAVDCTAWRMIEDRRRAVGLPSLEEAQRPPVWLATAAQRGLGTADPARIDVATV